MKKIIFTIALLMSLTAFSQYQFVSPNFGYYMYQTYPGCVTNPSLQVYVLDTLCAEVLQEDSLSPFSSYYGSTDLKYFKNLKYLNLGITQMDSLPVILPNTILSLILESNVINPSITLPPNLEKLRFGRRFRRFYFNNIPNTLKEFKLGIIQSDLIGEPEPVNLIDRFFFQVPDSLEIFQIDYESSYIYAPRDTIDEFPSFENASKLKSFHCALGYDEGTGLRKLPEFHDNTQSIYLRNTNSFMDSIHSFPANLKSLELSVGGLRYIHSFPEQLQKLKIWFEHAYCLPPFPESLIELSAPGYCYPNYIPGLNINLQHLCSNPGYFNTSPSDLCLQDYRSVSGVVFHDNNANCQFESTDLKMRNIPVSLFDENNEFLKKIYSDGYGGYAFTLPNGNYKIKLDTNEFTYRSACLSAYEFDFSLSDANPFISHDFELDCDTLLFNELDSFDIHLLNINNYVVFRPGGTSRISVSSKDCISNEQLACSSAIENFPDSTVNYKIKITGPVSFSDTSSRFTTSYSGDTLIVTYSDTVGESYGYRLSHFDVIVDSTAQLGDLICVYAEVLPPNGDVNLSNNSMTRCFQVVNSYDPNMKETWPFQMKPGFDDEIRYTIHFQNTGNAPAINIQLVDTLDEKLDLSTFRVIQASHDVVPSLDGRKLRFKFMNINLADSLSYPEGSKGYVEYAIKPLNPMQLDEKIFNTAYIYFDFNEPIITNTSVNWCTIHELSVEDLVSEKNLIVYPNPLGSDRLLKITKNCSEEVKISLFDLQGTEAGKFILNTHQNELKLEGLNSGVYILKFESASGVYSKKLVLM